MSARLVRPCLGVPEEEKALTALILTISTACDSPPHMRVLASGKCWFWRQQCHILRPRARGGSNEGQWPSAQAAHCCHHTDHMYDAQIKSQESRCPPG